METLKNIILKGVLKDLLLAERSFTLNQEINISYHSIPKDVSVDIANILYNLSYTEMVLSLCRIFDTPHKKYPTQCLMQIYDVFKEADYNLDVPYKEEVLLQAHFFDLPDNFIELLHNSSTKKFNKRAVAYFECDEINEPLISALKNLKNIRDKLLAHNEDVSINSLINYDSIQTMLKHAQNAISFFSLAYCGIHLKASNRFYLSSTAGKWSNTFKRFLKEKDFR